MARSVSVLRVRRDGPTITFRAEGQACMAQGLALRRHVERGLDDGARAVRVDLAPCTYMDSTFLGTLLYLKKTMSRGRGGDFALVTPSPECRGLLKQMGVEDLFPVVGADKPEDAEWTLLHGDLGDLEACKVGVVEAHEELAHLPGPAGEPFRKVMQCLGNKP